MPTFQDDKGRIVVRVYGSPNRVNNRRKPWMLSEGEVAKNTGWDYTIGGEKTIHPGVKSFFCSAYSCKGLAFVPDAFDYSIDYGGGSVVRTGSAIIDRRYHSYHVIRPGGYSHFGSTDNAAVTGYPKLIKTCLSGPRGAVSLALGIRPTMAACDSYPHPSSYTLASPLFVDWDYLDPTSTFYPFWFTGSPSSSTSKDSVRPTSMEWFQGRLWIANNQGLATGASGAALGLSSTTELFFGDDLQPSKLYQVCDNDTIGPAFDHPILYIEPGLGGRITGLKAIRGEEPALIVFKESAICLFQPRWGSDSGYLSQSADTIDTIESRIRVLNAHIGCPAQKTIVEVPSQNGTDLIFLASDGHIRRLSRSITDVPAGSGRPLTYDCPELLDRISMLYIQRASAVFWDNRYLISLPLDGASYPTHIAAFDPESGSLLSVVPYTHEQIIDVPMWGTDTIRPKVAFGSLLTTTDTSPTGASVGYHLFSFFDESSTRDPDDADMTAEEDTQAFTFGVDDRKKRFHYFAAMMHPCTSHTGSLAVQYSVDGSTFSHLATLTIAQATTDLRPRKQKADLSTIPPNYFIQYRLTASGNSRFSIAYIESAATVIQEEFDNTIT